MVRAEATGSDRLITAWFNNTLFQRRQNVQRKEFFLSLFLLTVILVSCLNLSACFVLPEETQRELEQQVQDGIKRVIQDAIDNAIEKVKDESERLWKTAKEKATDALNDLQESAGNTIDKAKEYAGWAVPEQCGFINSSTPTLTAKMDIARAFQDLYKGSGSGRVIGWPDDDVQVYSDSSGKWLYQYFLGGSETRSMMIMKDGESTAYLVPGEWLKTYENLGGLKDAGKPVSSILNFDNWLLWGKDKIQRYAWQGEAYVLMKPGDVEQVMVIPPLFWNYYLDNDGISELGAALSSYPLDEENAIDALSSNSKFGDLIDVWKLQPLRIQVFEKGSLIYNTDSSTFRLVKAQSLSGGETNLAYTAGPILQREKYNITSDQCFSDTVRRAGGLATSKGVGDLIIKISFIPAEAVTTVYGWTAETLGGKLFFGLAKLAIADAKNENMIYATGEAVVSHALDGLYGKVIGDTLSGPISDVSISAAKNAYSNLQKDRLSFRLSSTNGDLKMSMNYDPWTHYAWGVITSDCQPQGYLYVMELNPKGVYIEDTLHYFDLSRNGVEIRP